MDRIYAKTQSELEEAGWVFTNTVERTVMDLEDGENLRGRTLVINSGNLPPLNQDQGLMYEIDDGAGGTLPYPCIYFSAGTTLGLGQMTIADAVLEAGQMQVLFDNGWIVNSGTEFKLREDMDIIVRFINDPDSLDPIFGTARYWGWENIIVK